MSNEGKLFVGGLNFDTTEETLAEAFGKYGTVEQVHVVRDRETGRPRGFGFVTFADAADAKDALEDMDGKYIDGRAIRVDRAKGGGQSGGRGYSRGGYNNYDGGYGRGDRSSGGGGRGYSAGYREYRGQGGYSRRGSHHDSSYGYSGHE